jgi:3-dehydroquinate synthetase
MKDAAMFKLLEQHTLADFQKNKELLDELIVKNALLKSKVVQDDEFEQGDRKLLNFGHTFGHAIENTYKLPHGHAVAIGMVVAACISEAYTNFKDTGRLIGLIKKYGLPVYYPFDGKKVLKVMQADKKKVKDRIHYVLLEKIGKGIVEPLPFSNVERMIKELAIKKTK